MPTLYRIRDWEDRYETAETRKLHALQWAAVPNKHDGLGYRRMAAQRNGVELFAAWVLLVQVASKGRRGQRGAIARDGRPLSPADLALMTGFPAGIFERALLFFSDPQQGWLLTTPLGADSAHAASGCEQSHGAPALPAAAPGAEAPPAAPADHPATPAESPGPPADSPAEGRKEGKEGKEGKAPPDPATALPPVLDAIEFAEPWREWVRIRQRGKKPKSSWAEYFGKQLAWLAPYGLAVATEIVSYSARNEYQGLFPPKAGSTRSTGAQPAGRPPTVWELREREKAILEALRELGDGRRGQTYVGMRPGHTSAYEWTAEGLAERARLNAELKTARAALAAAPA